MNCKICGVKMAENWASGICCHCDWHLGEGYTKREIKEILKKIKEEK
jgi:hypothetical protein